LQLNKSEKARRGISAENDTITPEDYNQKLQELHSVKAELERVRKDKNIISGLVNQTQRDMSNKV